MANKILFTHSGTVIHGEKVGRTIGFPTVNIDRLPSPERPRGVYAGWCRIAGEGAASYTGATSTTTEPQKYWCAAYFGPRLIFGETKDCFEAYLYDFNEEIYGAQLEFELLEFIRPPMPFTTLDALKEQLQKDKQNGLTIKIRGR